VFIHTRSILCLFGTKKTRCRRLTPILIRCLLVAQIYVSTTGIDTNSGAINAPVRSITKARGGLDFSGRRFELTRFFIRLPNILQE
jgi:hypothetical protein